MYIESTVTVVSADNPASASLGGFKKSAAAFRFCRHCMGTESQVQSKVCTQSLMFYFICNFHSSMIHNLSVVQKLYIKSTAYL